MTRCQQNGCQERATAVVYWPGKTTLQCETHKDKVLRVAEFMGFDCDSAPFDEPPLASDPSQAT
jgi:hypothetical protein